MNYLNKFIKYKTKYVKLKNNQIGCGNTGAKNKLIQAINKFNDNEKKAFIIKLQLSDNNNKLDNNSLGCIALKNFEINDIIFIIPQNSIIGIDNIINSELTKFLINSLN